MVTQLLVRAAHWVVGHYEPEMAIVPINIVNDGKRLEHEEHIYHWRIAVMVWCMWADRAGSPTYDAMRDASKDRSKAFRDGWMQTTALLRESRVLGKTTRGTVWLNGMTPRVVSQWMRNDPRPLPFPEALPVMYLIAEERGTERNGRRNDGKPFRIPERRNARIDAATVNDDIVAGGEITLE